MSFDKIISIPGMAGLFKMVAQMRNGGFVVEGLADGKRIPVSAMQRITMLKDISVYTMEDDMPLAKVFLKMKENDSVASSISSKADPADLKSTLKKVLPEFDEDRVHVSDIRKMFSWYGLLKDVVSFDEPEPEEEAPVSDDTKDAVAEAPSKKKSTSAKAEESEVSADVTPAKKTARKKKADTEVNDSSTEEKAPPAKKTTRKSSKATE